MTKPISEAVTYYWGPKCKEFDPECACCDAWAQLGDLEKAEVELARRDAAIVERHNEAITRRENGL